MGCSLEKSPVNWQIIMHVLSSSYDNIMRRAEKKIFFYTNEIIFDQYIYVYCLINLTLYCIYLYILVVIISYVYYSEAYFSFISRHTFFY